MNTSDFTDNSLTGIATVMHGRAIITKTLSSDFTTEGTESFTFNIKTSAGGPIIATSAPIIVSDTSVGLVLNLDAGNTSSYPGSGTTWTDLIGGNNGTLTNGPTYSGANGGSIVFDGTNDYVNIGVGKGVNQFSGDFAISVWVMTDSTGSTFGNIIGDYYTNSVGTTNEWQLMISNGAQISFYRVGTGSIFNIASGYSANTWINVAVTRIGSTISLYTNSNLIATATNSEIFGTATGNLNIGIDGNNTSEPFKGKIATVQIYKNKGLSAAEVSQNFNALRGRYGL
jgi:hypothetical protein